MIIDLTSLNFGKTDEILIEETITFPKEDLNSANILELNDIKVIGNITKDSINNYILSLNIKGNMILPCSRTLKPVDYDLDLEIEENLTENEEMFKKNQKTIDILPIIWENILMEIPIRIISPDAEDIELKGDGWELITDSDN